MSLIYPVTAKHLTNFIASRTKYSFFYMIWDISAINRLCMRPLYWNGFSDANWLKKDWRKFCLKNFNKILCFLLDLVCFRPLFFHSRFLRGKELNLNFWGNILQVKRICYIHTQNWRTNKKFKNSISFQLFGFHFTCSLIPLILITNLFV